MKIGTVCMVFMIGMLFSGITSSHTTADQSFSQRMSQNKKNHMQSFQVNNMRGGKIIETDRMIVIQGATFVSNRNDKQPVIEINNVKDKKIVLNNVRVVADGTKISNRSGDAAIVKIDNSGKSNTKIVTRKLKVDGSNVNLKAQVGDGGSACAALVCMNTGDKDQMQMIEVQVKGNNKIEAVAGN